VRAAVLAAVDEAGDDGLAFKDLAACVGDKLTDDERARLGSLWWHTTVVKLNMEVDGELCRIADESPQRIKRA
jgi:hypothetical protein